VDLAAARPLLTPSLAAPLSPRRPRASSREDKAAASCRTPHQARKEFLKVTERSLNVIENKGSLWNHWERSWNVFENKRGYAFKAVMYMKTSQIALS
jgi:hypothetical protein